MNDFNFIPEGNLDPESVRLVQAAEQALEHAHAPYSQFRVGAALLLEDRQHQHHILTGTNQESAAFPSGLCAERVALFTLAAQSWRNTQRPEWQILRMVVVAKKMNATLLSPVTCCGACRQVMLDFERRQNKSFEVLMLAEDRQWILAPSAASLLPFCFTEATLDL